jgi:hypothetical protein
MAPRANWKGFLRLSLVTCPVALYPATSDSKRSASTRSIGILVTASSTRVLLRFETRWWVDKRMDLADLTYVWRGRRGVDGRRSHRGPA